MSEFIDNKSRKRVKDLLKFSIGIMEGEDGRELIDKYKEAIENVTPHDIVAMEDKQVNMGVSPAKIKKHIEKILNVIGSYLEKYSWEEPGEGHPLYYFMQENRALENHLAQMKVLIKKIELEKRVEEIEKLRLYLKKLQNFNKHYLRKENILFPYLERKWDTYRPLQIMWSLHDDIREHWKTLDLLLEDAEEFNHQIRKNLGELFLLMYRMIFKEEEIIFPLAVETVHNDEWYEMQNQSHEIGYAFIEPPQLEVESAQKGKDSYTGVDDLSLTNENLSTGQVLIGMGTGVLNLEQIILMLNKLPVDITYVDENDTVKYFSRPEERLFPRSPAVIGRSVQNCHPPESVHIVNKILDSFRSGEEDRAKFWIQMKGKFILIQYFALRNSQGEYKGTLEVSQDVTEIKKLEGEKRLLDWGNSLSQ